MRLNRLCMFPLSLMLFVSPTGGSKSPESESESPDIDTSRGFLEMCASVEKKAAEQSPFEIFKSGYCVGWVNGLTRGFVVGEAFVDTKATHRVFKQVYCPPEGNSYGQMIRVIKKFIADHPEKEHFQTGVLAGVALREAFPCKEESK